MPDLDGAINYALRRLKNELSPKLTYHSLSHTRDEVAVAVAHLAEAEGIHGHNLTLLITAAYFHDLGFVVQRKDHEEKSAEITAQVLPQFHYSDEQIRIIQAIIMATRLPQMPNTLLEQVMADGDLDNFGQDTFFDRSTDLRNELSTFGVHSVDLDWYTNQLSFLSSHQYFTRTAYQWRDPKKQENIQKLKILIRNIEASSKDC